MALVSFYSPGKIRDMETTLKKNRLGKPNPGLLTSFSNRVGAMVLGAFLIPFGILCGYFLFAEHSTFFRKVIFFLGMVGVPLGFLILAKAFYAFGKTARAHRFFYYDATRIVMGETNPIDKADIKRILRTAKAERIGMLTAVAPGFVEVPSKAIEYIGLHVEKPTLHIDKLTIKGGGAEIIVDFSALLPSINLSGIQGDMAFNSISQFYTQATGNTVMASIENP